MHLLWKVDFLDPRRASTRYRALYPAGWLREAGHTVVVADRLSADDLDGADAIVFSKAFRPADAMLAHAAAARGVPVVLDICDDIFVEGYGGGPGLLMSGVFQAMARVAAAVVVTGPALAEALAPRLPADLPVVAIPDPLETREAMQAVLGASGVDRVRRPARLAHSAVPLGTLLRRGWRYRHRLRHLAGKAVFAAKTIAVRGPRDPAWLANGIRRRLRSGMAGWKPPPAPHRAGPPSRRPERTVIWFGNSGERFADYGMRTLLLIAPELVRIAAESPFRLLVVSDDAALFEAEIAPLPLATEYRDWDPHRILDDIAAADVCIIPNSLDAFSRCKSANRAALALSLGVPVVATATPALAPLAGCLRLDDFEGGLRDCLSDPATARRAAEAARPVVEGLYGRRAIADAWTALLRRVADRPAPVTAGGRLPVLFFLDLVQDLDVTLPVIEAALADERMAPAVWVTGGLAARSPRVVAALRALGVTPRLVSAVGDAAVVGQALRRHAALVTGSESTAGPHRRAHALTLLANEAGLATFTLQHGVETIGLTWFDPVHDGSVRFASRWILLWGPPETLSPHVPPETRAKCVPAGRPVAALPRSPALPLPSGAGPCVAVFENLHWHRYDAEFRARFIADLGRLAAAFPEVRFLVKPHHAGRWLAAAGRIDEAAAGNLVIADPVDPAWEPFTAPAIIAAVDAAITTPSTVALDAAMAGKPVAVVGYGLDLTAYAPLPVLRDVEDWQSFVAGILSGAADRAPGDAFVARTLLPGDAAARVLRLVARETAAIERSGKSLN